MMLKKSCFGLAFIILVAGACSASTEKTKDDAGDGGEDAVTPSYDAGVDDVIGEESSDAADGDTGPEYIPLIEMCGNGKVEGFKQCDDGDLEERNGCTRM